MINDNHNSSCRFAEDLVSYLYGEIGEKEKAKFEAHLPNCGSCAEELAAFGVVRSSVLEWREKDFAPLQTPAVELPQMPTTVTVETVAPTRSWLAGLREIFSLSPSYAATAFAALILCAGLFYVGMSFLRTNGEKEISELNKQATVFEVEPEPTVEIAETPLKVQSGENEQTAKVTDSGKVENNKTANQSGDNKKQTLPTSKKNVVPVKAKVQPKPGRNSKPAVNAPRAPKAEDVQMLSDRGEEDETLRLMDLLEEIGGR